MRSCFLLFSVLAMGLWKKSRFSTNISLYLRNGMRYRHNFNGILIETYIRPTRGCHFEWPRVTVSDLSKYSMTRSVAWSLCDSWASCIIYDSSIKYTDFGWYRSGLTAPVFVPSLGYTAASYTVNTRWDQRQSLQWLRRWLHVTCSLLLPQRAYCTDWTW